MAGLTSPNISETTTLEANNRLQGSLVWDNLLPWLPVYNIDAIDDILPAAKAAGVNFFSLSMAAGAGASASLETIIERIARVKREIHARSDWLVFASTVADIRQAKADNKLAVNFNFQETLPFGRNLDLIPLFYDLGVRQTLLAYNQKNLVGDGCNERTDAGLSHFGVEVVKTMNRVGMLVDGSHSGHRTHHGSHGTLRRPLCVFPTPTLMGVYKHFRNIKDDQIDACVATGGVIGVVGAGAFLGDADASTESIFRCLDYLVERAGEQHVGFRLGTMSMMPRPLIKCALKPPTAWPNTQPYRYAGASQLADLTQMMIDHGYTDQNHYRHPG